jgi:hypothetical protein
MSVITRVAGTGNEGNSGDAQLNSPTGVAVTADGGFLVAYRDTHVVRKVSSAGVITRVAGTGNLGDSGDGGPATAAEIAGPFGVAGTADGGFLIGHFFDHVVRKVSSAGVITRVAGTGTTSAIGGDDDPPPVEFSGDGGPATAAQLNAPQGVTGTADGGFLIADTNNHVVRKVSSAGVIMSVAGTGTTPGNSGDGGPATAAEIAGPFGVAVTADGGFLIADTNNHVVRKVSSAGVITRVAGTGTLGNSGDGGPATAAELNFPLGVAVTADGGFLIADYGNHVVRKVAHAD